MIGKYQILLVFLFLLSPVYAQPLIEEDIDEYDYIIERKASAKTRITSAQFKIIKGRANNVEILEKISRIPRNLVPLVVNDKAVNGYYPFLTFLKMDVAVSKTFKFPKDGKYSIGGKLWTLDELKERIKKQKLPEKEDPE